MPSPVKCKECDIDIFEAKKFALYFEVSTKQIPDKPGWVTYISLGPVHADAYHGVQFCNVECLSKWAAKWVAVHEARMGYYSAQRENKSAPSDANQIAVDESLSTYSRAMKAAGVIKPASSASHEVT